MPVRSLGKVADRHLGTWHDLVGRGRGLAHLSVTQHLLELTDAGLGLPLLLTGGMVAAVLRKVAFRTGVGNLVGNGGAAFAFEVLQLLGELIEGLLGQPHSVFRLRHLFSLPRVSPDRSTLLQIGGDSPREGLNAGADCFILR